MGKSHRSLKSYGQSTQVHLPELAETGQYPNILPGHSGGSFAQNARRLATQNTSQSSISFILFTACIIALIMFSVMKLLSAKFKTASMRYDKSQFASKTDHGDHDECPGTAERRKQRQQQARCSYDNDLSYSDKKKLSRLSREERTRRLIMRHGGKSVSSAIRFIISEFEEQKRQLMAQSGVGATNPDGVGRHEATSNGCCDCSCHLVDTSEHNDIVKDDASSHQQQEPVDSDQATTVSELEVCEGVLG